VTASHSGEPRHIAIVRRVLDDRGLRVDDLANTPALPLNEHSAREIVRAGGSATSLTQNCSGKHAGMLATCVVNGWPLDSYLDADHPLQHAITEVFAELPMSRSGTSVSTAVEHRFTPYRWPVWRAFGLVTAPPDT
jgi:L-asparaginase II